MIGPTVKDPRVLNTAQPSEKFATMATATTKNIAQKMEDINEEMVSARVEQNILKDELAKVDEEIAALQDQTDKDNLPIGTTLKDIQDRLKNAKTERKKLDSKFQQTTTSIKDLTQQFAAALGSLAEASSTEIYDAVKKDHQKEVNALAKEMQDLKIKANRSEREAFRERRPSRDEDIDHRSAPGVTPRTRSLAQLPTLQKASDFTEHIQRVKTYFRLNAVTSNADKKDLLLMSFTPDLALRIQGIIPNEDPYNSMDFETFCNEVKLRMIPRASSSILRTQFENLTQKSDEYVVDYLLEKQSLFAKAYPPSSAPMPVSFLTRHLMEGIFNENLKSELWRQVADEEEANESSEPGEIISSFNRLLQKTNSALDFVRRTNNIKGNQDRKGLSLTSPPKTSGLPTHLSQFGMQGKINQVREEGHQSEEWEEEQWASEDLPEDGIYTIGDEDDGDEQLTDEQVNFCRLVEEENQTKFWEEGCEESISELRKEGGRRTLLCWVCNSDQHLKKACPTRLKVVSQRVSAVMTPEGGKQWRRGASRGSRSWSRGQGARGGRGRAPAPSSTAPFGFGRGGQGVFYPPGVRPTYFPSQPRGFRGQHF